MKKIFNQRGKTLVMGILNVTPDSFSDGGKYLSPDAAMAHAAQMIEYGADIIDIGAESTADEEFSRLKKILPAIRKLGVPISIDTYKPEVAEKVLRRGAKIINDVHGLEDSRMLDVAKKFHAHVIAMHNEKCSDGDIISDIKRFFLRTLENCAAKKFNTKKIMFDPGIGFGKTPEEDLEIILRLDELKTLNGKEINLMIGLSRKKFIGKMLGLPLDQRDEATGAFCVHAITKGVDLVRVHNVKMISRMCLTADELRRQAS